MLAHTCDLSFEVVLCIQQLSWHSAVPLLSIMYWPVDATKTFKWAGDIYHPIQQGSYPR